jgi:hypothetical protein
MRRDREAGAVGPGITLLVIGAILAFAVRADGEVVDIQTVGLILMLAGAGVIAYARRERYTKEVETRAEERLDSSGAPHAVREVVTHEVVSGEEETETLAQQAQQGRIAGESGAGGRTAPKDSTG